MYLSNQRCTSDLKKSDTDSFVSGHVIITKTYSIGDANGISISSLHKVLLEIMASNPWLRYGRTVRDRRRAGLSLDLALMLDVILTGRNMDYLMLKGP